LDEVRKNRRIASPCLILQVVTTLSEGAVSNSKELIYRKRTLDEHALNGRSAARHRPCWASRPTCADVRLLVYQSIGSDRCMIAPQPVQRVVAIR
jgi:hypothetical protein